MNYKKSNNKWIFLILGVIITILINYSFLNNLIIPDPCFCHLNPTNYWIDLFYNSGNINNGHPEPNILNFLLTILIGLLIGKIGYNYYLKNNQNEIQ
jgi:hypothetical protein